MKASSNEIEGGVLFSEIVLYIAFLFDRVVDGKEFGKLYQLFLFPEMGACTLAWYRGFSVGWGANRVILDA